METKEGRRRGRGEEAKLGHLAFNSRHLFKKLIYLRALQEQTEHNLHHRRRSWLSTQYLPPHLPLTLSHARRARVSNLKTVLPLTSIDALTLGWSGQSAALRRYEARVLAVRRASVASLGRCPQASSSSKGPVELSGSRSHPYVAYGLGTVLFLFSLRGSSCAGECEWVGRWRGPMNTVKS